MKFLYQPMMVVLFIITTQFQSSLQKTLMLLTLPLAKTKILNKHFFFLINTKG